MKKTKRDDYHVIVYPKRLGDFGGISMSDSMVCPERLIESEYKERCEQIKADIQRHVDNAGVVVIHSTAVETCAHCGAKWTEEGDTYNGGCCEEDAQHEPAEEVEP